MSAIRITHCSTTIRALVNHGRGWDISERRKAAARQTRRFDIRIAFIQWLNKQQIELVRKRDRVTPPNIHSRARACP
jgi:hypothetical protein